MCFCCCCCCCFLLFDVNYCCCCCCCCCCCRCYCCCCCCSYCCVVVVTEEYFCVNDKLIIFVDTKDIFRFKLCTITRAITITYMNPFWFLYQFWCFLFFNFPKTINNNWLEKGSKKMRMPYTVLSGSIYISLSFQ